MPDFKFCNNNNLVLLHGLGFNAAIFAPLISMLDNKYSISNINLPGHGDAISLDNNLDNWVNYILPKIPPNPIILGWSLGGLVAIKISSIINIKKLILVAASPKFINDDNWDYAISNKNFILFKKNLTTNTKNGLLRFIDLQGLPLLRKKQITQLVINNLPTISAINKALSILEYADLRAELIKIKSKTQIILGTKDTIVPIKIFDWYQQNNFTVTKINTGHMPFLDNDFCQLAKL